MWQAVSTFEMPPAAVAAHMRAVAQLQPPGKAGGAPWSVALLASAERELSAFVASVSQNRAKNMLGHFGMSLNS